MKGNSILEDTKSRVYILIDDNNRVDRLEGEYTLPSDLTNWILIDEGYGDKYNLAQTHYLEKPLIDDDRTHNYIYENDSIREATEKEKDEERVIPITEPTLEERINDLENAICEIIDVISE